MKYLCTQEIFDLIDTDGGGDVVEEGRVEGLFDFVVPSG